MRPDRGGRTGGQQAREEGEGGRVKGRGRRASSEGKERAASRTAKMSATTCRAEKCRTEIQANVKRLVKFPKAHKITTGPRASALLMWCCGLLLCGGRSGVTGFSKR